jgi:hypothetical protein
MMVRTSMDVDIYNVSGQRRSTLPCGHTLCAMPHTFTTTYQCWRMAHKGWRFSTQFVLAVT